jgi:hypothetical protein
MLKPVIHANLLYPPGLVVGGGVAFGYGIIMFACEFQNRKHGFKK